MVDSRVEQLSFFDGLEAKGIQIDIAAQRLGVSKATIRNWMKTGYLKKDADGLIDELSCNQFVNNFAGLEKLNSRANKSCKDTHDHEQLKLKILSKISDDELFYDSIGAEYENDLSDSYRNKEGIYYTPQDIVNDMLRLEIGDVTDKKFCDPCCGSGNFVVRALELGFKPENIYGFDSDAVAIAILKKRILNITGRHCENIIQADFLEYISNHRLMFDYIYTNPPWGKKLPKEEKEKYAAAFGAGKSLDTSALFFCASLYCLHEKGSLGFLLPEAFFNIAAFEDARIKVLDFAMERLIDYGKPFEGLMTKAQAVILSKKAPDIYDVQCEKEKQTFTRSLQSFKKNPKAIFNFHVTEEQTAVIEHIYSIPHITLLKRAKWGLGIVTGNNKKFVRDTFKEGFMPVFKGSDITYGGLKAPSLFIPKDLSLYQQAAPVELYEASEKLVYKFICSQLCFFYDCEQRYLLNSANMMIPLENFPLTCHQLADLLNSKFMNRLFTRIFSTYKILRGDLETLPIHADFFEHNQTFNEEKYLDFLGIEELKNGTYRVKK